MCRQWPIDWHTDMSQFMCSNWTRNCWSPSIWSQMFLHQCITLKNVMNHWPAPDHNSNDYWHFTYDQKKSGRNFLQTSVILTVSRQRYTKGPYKEGDSQTNLRCCFHCPATLRPLLHRKSVSLMMPHLTY